MSKTRLVGGVLAAAIAFVGGWEGLRLYSYKDVVGVWMACYGETRGIKPGMKFTKAQCDKQFAARLVEFETGMRRCLKQPDTLPQETYLAFLSVFLNEITGGEQIAFSAKSAGKRVDSVSHT